MGREVGGWVKKMKGLRSTNWQLPNSHKDVKDSKGNIVKNIVITMYGVRWVPDLSGNHFVNYMSNCYAIHLKAI